MNEKPDDRPSAKRWWIVWTGRVFLLLVLAVIAFAAPMACTTTVVPPVDPPQPATVFLLDHGRTPSLVLPDGQDRMIRYVYGDWNYYALRNTGWWDGLRAVAWPTQGTLGRQAMSGPPRMETIREQLTVGVENIYALEVAQADLDRLRTQLDQEHQAGRQSQTAEALGMEFVPHPRRYTYFYNSNHAVADWLQALGCRVNGPAFNSRWQLARARDG